MKVFIADDSTIVRERLITILSDIEEIDVVGQASKGDEAIELIEKLNPDVLVLDIRMPGVNGIETLQKIRETNLDIVVIMLTNYPYPQYKKKCLESGANYFLDKSNEFEKIPEILDQIREKSKQ